MKNLVILSITTLVLINSQDVYSDIKADLILCKNITSNTERLECFDSTVEGYHPKVVSKMESAGNSSSENPKPAALVTPNQIRDVQATVEVKKTEKTALISDDFGMEMVNKGEAINSFLVGEFKSWKKGMKLHLKNGQVWKVLSSRSGYRKIKEPAITISRGFFGSFNAKIEGLNATAKVKRLK